MDKIMGPLAVVAGLSALCHTSIPLTRPDKPSAVAVCYPYDADISKRPDNAIVIRTNNGYISGIVKSNAGTLFSVRQLPLSGIPCSTMEDLTIPHVDLPGFPGVNGDYYAYLPNDQTIAVHEPTFITGDSKVPAEILTSKLGTNGGAYVSGFLIPPMSLSAANGHNKAVSETIACPHDTDKPGKMEFRSVSVDVAKQLAYRITIGAIKVDDQKAYQPNDRRTQASSWQTGHLKGPCSS